MQRFKHGKWVLPTFVVSVVLGALIAIQFQAQVKLEKTKLLNAQKVAVSNELLDKAAAEKKSLEAQQKDLKRQIEELSQRTGGVSQNLKNSIDNMGVFTGETPVEGPGIHLEIDDRKDPLFNPVDTFMTTINILKEAGAEAIELAGQRIGPRTSIASSGPSNILVNGTPISRAKGTHWEIEAIGDQDTLKKYLQDLELDSLMSSYPDLNIQLTEQWVSIPGLKGVEDFSLAKPVQ